jgi:hypothetical protein
MVMQTWVQALVSCNGAVLLFTLGRIEWFHETSACGEGIVKIVCTFVYDQLLNLGFWSNIKHLYIRYVLQLIENWSTFKVLDVDEGSTHSAA